jgi:WD40 repeat protein
LWQIGKQTNLCLIS